MLVALSRDALPFAITVTAPSKFAKGSEDIGHYRVSVRKAGGLFPTMPSHRDYAAADALALLLFYDPSVGLKENEILFRLPRILDGDMGVLRGKISVMTVIEKLDSWKELEFKMAKWRAEKMKNEGWRMIAWRCDMDVFGEYQSIDASGLFSMLMVSLYTATWPVDAAQWTEVTQ